MTRLACRLPLEGGLYFLPDYKFGGIHRQRWQSRAEVELATLKGVDGFNHRRSWGPIGHIPPAEAEMEYYQQQNDLAHVA